MFFTAQSQLTIAEIEGDLKLRGAINVHHSIDSTVMLIGYKAGAELNREIFDLLDSDDFYFPRATTLAGVSAGEFSNGVFNAFFGFQAGQNMNNISYGNEIIGFQAGKNITSGDYNLVIGNKRGFDLSTGNYNTLSG